MTETQSQKIHCCINVHNYIELLETNVYLEVSFAVIAITPRPKLGLSITCKK